MDHNRNQREITQDVPRVPTQRRRSFGEDEDTHQRSNSAPSKKVEVTLKLPVFFLAHLSTRLMFSDHKLSIVCLCCCSCRKLFTFSSSSPEQREPISNKLSTNHPWVMGIQVCSNEGQSLFVRGDNYEMAKNTLTNLIIFFSRTTGPISTKLGKGHPWVMGIQVCSNEGPLRFPRGDNYEIAKIH